MNGQTASTASVLVALIATAPIGAAAAPPAGLVPADGSAAFRFATSVKTPKGTHSGAGTITVKRTGTREIALTVQPDGGAPARTVSLIIGVDGSVAPDPATATQTPTDATAKAQADAFMAEMTIAAHVGIGARKNSGASTYEVPVKLTPVGSGTPVAAQLSMSGTLAQYTGSTIGQTQTQLPPGGSLDPEEIAKTIGISAFAHHAFTPVGRAATAIVMHRKRKEEKAAASGLLPDLIHMTVTADLADGKIREIRGSQTDQIDISGKPVDIASTWTFTKTSGGI